MAEEDKRLDRQQAYQHFHIGIYVTLGTAIIGVAFFDPGKLPHINGLLRVALMMALIFLALAGACGGMVAARIPGSQTYEELNKDRYGFSLPNRFPDWPKFKAQTWESLEHLFFWIAMLILTIFGASIVIFGPPA